MHISNKTFALPGNVQWSCWEIFYSEIKFPFTVLLDVINVEEKVCLSIINHYYTPREKLNIEKEHILMSNKHRMPFSPFRHKHKILKTKQKTKAGLGPQLENVTTDQSSPQRRWDKLGWALICNSFSQSSSYEWKEQLSVWRYFMRNHSPALSNEHKVFLISCYTSFESLNALTGRNCFEAE